MIEILNNMRRRKMRTVLTILGVTIGIFALTVMGSLSEFVNRMVNAEIEQAAGTINIESKFSMGAPGSAPLPDDAQAKIEAMPEVKEVTPYVITVLGNLNDKPEGESYFASLVGMPPEDVGKRMGLVKIDKGQNLVAGDKDEIVIGSAIAKRYNLKVGDTAVFRKHTWKVKGIIEPIQVFYYNESVTAPLDTVRQVTGLAPNYVGLMVIPKDANKIEEVADTIQKEIPDLRVQSPEKAKKDAENATLIFNAIVLFGAILAVVIGGVATMNTMMFAISERTREIGLKKAVGATRWSIMREYVQEAAVLGLIGGVAGLVVGWLTTIALNSYAEQTWTLRLFEVTPRLIIISLIFATVLGGVAGIYPAWRAARMDPVHALRSE